MIRGDFVRRYIVTRPAETADALSAGLRSIGIEPLEVPAVAISPPASWQALDEAVRAIEGFDWVLLTSRNGVEALFSRAGAGVWPHRLRWAAIGPGTAQALRDRGIAGAWMPSRFTSDAVGSEMPARRGERVLRIMAEQASAAPTRALSGRGVEVTEVTAYRTTEAPPSSRGQLREAWGRGVEGVIFTSASTVRGVMRLAEETGLQEELRSVRLIAIGPVTAAALRAEGLPPTAVASEHSVPGLLAVLAERSEGDAARVHGS